MKRIGLAAIFAAFLVNVLVFPCSVQTVVVDTGTITVPDDYPTIQAAINAASDGDTIFVRNGTYYENVYISKDNVTLRGEDRAATVIDGQGVGTVVKITGDNVSFHGFEVRNCSWGFPFYGILLDHSNNTKITNNIVALNQETGIWVDCSHHNTFINNIITSNKEDGILLRYSHNNTISDNVLSHNAGDGISIFGSDNTTVIGNTVTSNWYGIGITGSTQNTLISNNLTDNIFNLDVVAYSLADFIHEIDTSNTVDGRPIYYLVSKCNETIPTSAGYAAAINSTYITAANLRLTNNGQGVLFAYTHNSLIKGINASDNVYAIWLHSSSNNTLIGNNLSYNNNGMCMHDFCSYNKITSNTIAFNNANGILLVSCRDNTFCLNNLIGNPYSQVEPGAFSNSWDNGCEGNYWSNHLGSDLNGDGIIDTPYVINVDNQDNYPLMNPYWSPGDINHDLKVDIYDVVLISGAYLSTPSDPRWNPHCDLVEPYGIIDIYDVVLMCGCFGEEYTP